MDGDASISLLLRIPQRPSKKLIAQLVNEGTGFNEKEIQLEARIRTLQKRSVAVPSNEELRNMILLIKRGSTHPHNPDDDKINYADFKRVGASVPERCRQYFSASTFLHFKQDEHLRIRIHALCQYILTTVILEQAWIRVSTHDSDLDERLSEAEMIRYVYEVLDNATTVRDFVAASPLLREVYALTIARKFFFYLDSLGQGAIRITSLITDPIFAELEALRKSENLLATSWFHIDHINRLYKKFRKLDADGNGRLGEDDLRRYTPAFTNGFITQLLVSRPTIDGELDYREFLNLELALVNQSAPQSIRYMFSVYDLEKKGFLEERDLAYFLKDLLVFLDDSLEPGEDNLGSNKGLAEDVMNQIFDLIQPKTPRVITLNDLLTSGAAHIFVSILSSSDLFDNWDQDEGGRLDYSQQLTPMSPPLSPHRFLAAYYAQGAVEGARPIPPARRAPHLFSTPTESSSI